MRYYCEASGGVVLSAKVSALRSVTSSKPQALTNPPVLGVVDSDLDQWRSAVCPRHLRWPIRVYGVN